MKPTLQTSQVTESRCSILYPVDAFLYVPRRLECRRSPHKATESHHRYRYWPLAMKFWSNSSPCGLDEALDLGLFVIELHPFGFLLLPGTPLVRDWAPGDCGTMDSNHFFEFRSTFTRVSSLIKAWSERQEHQDVFLGCFPWKMGSDRTYCQHHEPRLLWVGGTIDRRRLT